MKKQILFLFIIFLITFVTPNFVLALSPTPSPTPTSKDTPTPTAKPQDTSLLNQITSLKEKIASRVAQLKLVEKRGIIGTVTDTSNVQITVTDAQNQTRFIDVDEITKFSQTGKTAIGISDLSKGMKISVLGLYNKDNRRITARFVDVITLPTYLTGEIASLDNPNRQFMLAKNDGSQSKIDIENTTKIYSFTKASNEVKTGFSKLNTGDVIYVIGYPDKKNPDMTVASIIEQFPEVAKNPQINVSIAPSSPVSPTKSTSK